MIGYPVILGHMGARISDNQSTALVQFCVIHIA